MLPLARAVSAGPDSLHGAGVQPAKIMAGPTERGDGCGGRGVASCPETIGLATGPADHPWQGIKGLPVPDMDSEMNVCLRDMMRAGRPIAAFLVRRSRSRVRRGLEWALAAIRSVATACRASRPRPARDVHLSEGELLDDASALPVRRRCLQGPGKSGDGQGGFVQSR